MKREYVIYHAPISVSYTFMNFKYALKHNWKLGDYVPVWRGNIESETVDEALDKLFYIFNMDRPKEFCGRSMSVSDVVMLDGKYYYCDSFGWSECPPERGD